MGVTYFRMRVPRGCSSNRLLEEWKRAASQVGYERHSVVPNADRDDSALLLQANADFSVPSGFHWPTVTYSPEQGDKVAFRYASSRDEHLLSVIGTLTFEDSKVVRDLEIAVNVGELIAYSEKRRDALLRATSIAQWMYDNEIADRISVVSEDGATRFELPQDGDVLHFQMPLETSRKRATRAFFDWISQGSTNNEKNVRRVLKEPPVLFLGNSIQTTQYELRHNLLNGSILPRSSDASLAAPDISDLEISYLRQCWGFENGLEDVQGKFGTPSYRMGGFDPTGTRISSLEIIRDQWVFTKLIGRKAVIFREYEDGRLSVNVLQETST